MRLTQRTILKTAFLAAALVATVTIGLASRAGADSFNPEQKKEIEALIRTYLLENPEVVIEAAMKHRAQQEAEAAVQQKKAVASAIVSLKKDKSYPRVGNAEGDVQFVEFFDYQCSFCKQVLPTVMDLLEEDKKLDVVMVEFPVLGPVSEFAAKAALASRNQNKYMEFHVALMGQRGRLNERKILKIAEDLGLDINQLQKDMNTPEITSHIQQNRNLAEALGLRGTPAFLIGKEIAPGAISKAQMMEMIDAARQGS